MTDAVVARVSIAHFHSAWGQLADVVTAARKAYEVGPWYPDARATLAAVLRITASKTKPGRYCNRSAHAAVRRHAPRLHRCYHLVAL